MNRFAAVGIAWVLTASPTIAFAPGSPEAELCHSQLSRPTDGSMMHVIVVRWAIVKGREEEFIRHWREKETVSNRGELLAEFMSKDDGRDQLPWFNWPKAPEGVTFYYNIGMWSGDGYQAQIGFRISGSARPQPFEHPDYPRIRMYLSPMAWRTGAAGLPCEDSRGTN